MRPILGFVWYFWQLNEIFEEKKGKCEIKEGRGRLKENENKKDKLCAQWRGKMVHGKHPHNTEQENKIYD